MSMTDEKLRKPRRKPRAGLHLIESPFPVPIETITGRESQDNKWYSYFGTIQNDHVIVSRLGDLTFLYRLGYFGKGVLSRSRPQFETYGDVLSEYAQSNYVRSKASRCDDKSREKARSNFLRSQQERLRQHACWISGKLHDEDNTIDNNETRMNDEKLLQCVDLHTFIDDGQIEEDSTDGENEPDLLAESKRDDIESESNTITESCNENKLGSFIETQQNINNESFSEVFVETHENTSGKQDHGTHENTLGKQVLETQENTSGKQDHGRHENTLGKQDHGTHENTLGKQVLETQENTSGKQDHGRHENTLGKQDHGTHENTLGKQALETQENTLGKQDHGTHENMRGKQACGTQDNTSGKEHCETHGKTSKKGDKHENDLPMKRSHSSDDLRIINSKKIKLEEDLYKIYESLQLTFEEAFFLSYGLGCLGILREKGGPIQDCMSMKEMWNFYRQRKRNFLQQYIAYHYFRSKGWVVRYGNMFGADFALYKDGMPFYHASYSVYVVMVTEEEVKTSASNFSWKQLSTMSRVNEKVAKEVLLCYVIKPKGLCENDLLSPSCVQTFRVIEMVFRRWLPEKHREIKEVR